MEPSVHKRKPGTYEATCGAGYPWPSSISFAASDAEVTCASCKRRLTTGPWTKTELELRRRSVREGWWNDSILVFEDREVYARNVLLVPGVPGKVRIVGYLRALDDSGATVDELVDPREVTRVVH